MLSTLLFQDMNLGGGGFDGAMPEMDDGKSLVIYTSNVVFPVNFSLETTTQLFLFFLIVQ